MITTINEKAFGKNDIRGIFGESVTATLFYYVGKAYVQFACENSDKKPRDIWVTVVRDARHHSPELAKSLKKGLTSAGANVIDLGLAPTPIGYFSEFANLDFGLPKKVNLTGTLIVTASHNPSEYNGLKMTFNKSSMTEAQIQKIKEITQEIAKKNDSSTYCYGITREANIIPEYIETMTNSFAKVGSGIKIVVDSANATAGVVAPELYRELGCEVIDIFTEPDGDFPNHHPNPSDLSTLKALQEKVLEENAEFGLAFDGDTDRIGIVDDKGRPIAGDKLLLILALDVVEQFKIRDEVATFVSEVKCSQVLYDEINKAGGRAIMWKTGHGYIKGKMKEEKAVIAGEMSGHIFFKDRYYGFDDAIYAGCRFIEIVAKKKQIDPNFKVSQLVDSLPFPEGTIDVRHPCKDELKKPVLEELAKIFAENKNIFINPIKDIITIDGLRLVFEDGYAIIRQSNTEPVFTMGFEAQTIKNATSYKDTMLNLVDDLIARFASN
ncbi:MAG: phosphomannomutase/phosphoglucomutase [bacterium]